MQVFSGGFKKNIKREAKNKDKWKEQRSRLKIGNKVDVN